MAKGDHLMKIPAWLKPGAIGVVLGAVVLAIIGFTWGGWVTGSSAKDMASTEAASDVAAALTPYCVADSKSAANAAATLKALNATDDYDPGSVIANAGWATPMGAKQPNSALAQDCANALTKSSS
jgi:hypothetical protein